MTLTLRDVLAMDDLGLMLRTAQSDLDTPIAWVAVSELADPAPWLSGQELLLTTGMRITAKSAPAYVKRLHEGGVRVVGFGIGTELTHAEIPAAFLEAAQSRGIAVVEVPEPVPFVAISRTVSQWLNAREYEESARSFATQRDLIRAALADGGSESLLAILAKHVQGFALHLDARGSVLAAYPVSAAARAEEWRDEIDRLRPRGLLASSSLANATEQIVLIPLGVRGSAAGFLAVGTPVPLRAIDQAVLNLAVSLLSWASSRPATAPGDVASLRAFVLRSALQVPIPGQAWTALGLASTVCAVAVRLPESHADHDAIIASLESIPQSLWLIDDARTVRGLIPAQESGAFVLPPEALAAGISSPVEFGHPARISMAWEQADDAARAGAGVHRHDQLAERGLTSLIDASMAQQWARGYLAPILASAEADELTDTMRAWIDSHGHVDSAATALGVHRHTVRHRLRRAEALLGRSLEDAAVRAELWFALQSLARG